MDCHSIKWNVICPKLSRTPISPEVMALVPRLGTNDGTNSDADHTSELSENESSVILELIKKPSVTYSELANETGLSRRTVSRILTILAEKKYIERIGNNRSGYWKVIQ